MIVAIRPAGTDRADRVGGTAAHRVRRKRHAVAPGRVAYVFRPCDVVVIDHVECLPRPEPVVIRRAGRRDHGCSAQRRERHDQAASDSTRSVDKDRFAGLHRERLREHLLCRQGRHWEAAAVSQLTDSGLLASSTAGATRRGAQVP